MTRDPCSLCGRIGHLPKDCDWPKDSQDLPEPKPAKPDLHNRWIPFFRSETATYQKGTP